MIPYPLHSFTASGSVAVAITALILNFRLWNSIERRIDTIEGDIKQFFKSLSAHDNEIARLKNHTGLKG